MQCVGLAELVIRIPQDDACLLLVSPTNLGKGFQVVLSTLVVQLAVAPDIDVYVPKAVGVSFLRDDFLWVCSLAQPVLSDCIQQTPLPAQVHVCNPKSLREKQADLPFTTP